MAATGCSPISGETTQILQEKPVADLNKCKDGGEHLLYAIDSANWVEEVGCELCDLKIVGQKAPTPEPIPFTRTSAAEPK